MTNSKPVQARPKPGPPSAGQLGLFRVSGDGGGGGGGGGGVFEVGGVAGRAGAAATRRPGGPRHRPVGPAPAPTNSCELPSPAALTPGCRRSRGSTSSSHGQEDHPGAEGQEARGGEGRGWGAVWGARGGAGPAKASPLPSHRPAIPGIWGAWGASRPRGLLDPWCQPDPWPGRSWGAQGGSETPTFIKRFLGVLPL